MEGKRPGVVLYLHDVQPILSQLTDADAGKLFRAVFKYADTGDLPSFDGALSMAWAVLKGHIDEDADRYEQICKKRKDAAYERWKSKSIQKMQVHPQDATDANINCNINCNSNTENLYKGKDKPSPTKKPFSPPTLQEVQEYIRERRSMVDARTFIDFYESKGWMVGRSKMKDWRAACRRAEKWDCWGKERDRVRTDAEYYEGW